MAKTLKSKRCSHCAPAPGAVTAVVIALVFAGQACGARSATSPTATEMPSAKRHPDGVVLEPPPALPGATLRADARGVVALREPLGIDAVRALVAEMTQALEREDPSAFENLLTSDAAYYEAARRLPRAALIEKWRARMQQLEYSRLAGMEIVRPEDIQTFDLEDVGGPGEPERPPEMQPGDVYVRAPITTSRIGTDKYFGAEFLLVLRPDGSKFRIAAYAEDDAD